MRVRAFFVAFIFILFPIALCAQENTGPCDRTCLEGYVDRYLDAMLENDPDLDLFSRDCKFTENGVRLPLGSEGLWFNMSARGDYKFWAQPSKRAATLRKKDNSWHWPYDSRSSTN